MAVADLGGVLSPKPQIDFTGFDYETEIVPHEYIDRPKESTVCDGRSLSKSGEGFLPAAITPAV